MRVIQTEQNKIKRKQLLVNESKGKKTHRIVFLKYETSDTTDRREGKNTRNDFFLKKGFQFASR